MAFNTLVLPTTGGLRLRRRISPVTWAIANLIHQTCAIWSVPRGSAKICEKIAPMRPKVAIASKESMPFE